MLLSQYHRPRSLEAACLTHGSEGLEVSDQGAASVKGLPVASSHGGKGINGERAKEREGEGKEANSSFMRTPLPK